VHQQLRRQAGAAGWVHRETTLTLSASGPVTTGLTRQRTERARFNPQRSACLSWKAAPAGTPWRGSFSSVPGVHNGHRGWRTRKRPPAESRGYSEHQPGIQRWGGARKRRTVRRSACWPVPTPGISPTPLRSPKLQVQKHPSAPSWGVWNAVLLLVGAQLLSAPLE
jgi:hypothetical protein